MTPSSLGDKQSRPYYAYQDGLFVYDGNQAVDFTFELVRPTGTSIEQFRYKASNEDDIDGTLTVFNSHLWSNLEPIVFRSFYFLFAASSTPPSSAIFGQDIRFIDLMSINEYSPLHRPDQMVATDQDFTKAIDNLITVYATTVSPHSGMIHYVCPLDEANAKLLAHAMPAYFTQFADYVGNDYTYGLSDTDRANLTNPDNWIAVYDPAIVRTKAVIPHENCLSGHDILQGNNKDFKNEPFCVQSDWVVRYTGAALQKRAYLPAPILPP